MREAKVRNSAYGYLQTYSGLPEHDGFHPISRKKAIGQQKAPPHNPRSFAARPAARRLTFGVVALTTRKGRH
jgi:hypothetical protein